jgi:hypothetical protein
MTTAQRLSCHNVSTSFLKTISGRVSALANRIVGDEDDNGSDRDDLLKVVGEEVDFMATLENLKGEIMMAEGLVGDLMSVESMDTDGT